MERKSYHLGSVRNGELWFPELRVATQPNWWLFREMRIKCLDLATGRERETDFAISSTVNQNLPWKHWPVWLNDELYVFTHWEVFKAEGNELRKLATLPTNTAPFHVRPFVYDGHLTTIAQTEDTVTRMWRDDEFRLVHLIDSRWVDGRKIILPERGRVWQDDPQLGRSAIWPRTSKPIAPTKTLGGYSSLLVEVDDQDVHLLLHYYGEFCAYRRGFEFVDDELKLASALAPANAKQEVSGWEYIPSMRPEDHLNSLHFAQGALSFRGISQSIDHADQCILRTSDGHWVSFAIQGMLDPNRKRRWINETRRLVVDSSDGAIYLIDGDPQWDTASFRRVDQQSVLPVHLTVKGIAGEYIARWERVAAGFVVAWLSHVALVTVGLSLGTGNRSASDYEFGIERVLLASVTRRSFALITDLLLIAMTVAATVWIQASVAPSKMDRVPDQEIGEQLIDFAVVFYSVGEIQDYLFGDKQQYFVREFGWLPEFPQRLFNLVMAGTFGRPRMADDTFRVNLILATATCVLFACGCLRIYLEGRHGITPGKWLFGIAAARTTLRACGIVRAVVRSLLLFVDLLWFVTPLPAAVSMLFSARRQRLGDRLADTIVIESRR